jgi:tricorn protease
VIDERYNGGGSAADYIIDVLQRDFDGYFNNVAGDRYPFTSPVGRHLGAEGDDHQRDGRLGRRPDAVHVQAPQDRPLVGKRTWGGLVHTADTPTFVDGGSMIAPRGGFFSREGKWAVENEGTRPTSTSRTGRRK